MENEPTPPTLSAEEILRNIERFNSELSVIKNEFDQAQDVWRSIVAGEKQEFQKLLGDHQTKWSQEDSEWAGARDLYEQKIKELEKFFSEKLQAIEKNAVNALNELDTAWQQERARWQETVNEQSKTIQESRDLLAATQQEMKLHVDKLTDEKMQLQSRMDQARSIELQLAEWQAEKATWQQTLSERLSEMQQAQAAWAVERHEKDTLIEGLVQENVRLEQQQQQQKEREAAAQQRPPIQVYMNTLETQVTALEDFVRQVMFPRRRRTDTDKNPAKPSNNPPRS